MGRILIACIFVAYALSACGADASPSGTSDRTNEPTVTIEAIAYRPALIEVAVGDTLSWTNEDESVKHTVTSGKPGDRGVPGLDNAVPDKPDGLFDGELATAGDMFEFTFDDAGTFEYFCRVHPVMTARVVVTD